MNRMPLYPKSSNSQVQATNISVACGLQSQTPCYQAGGHLSGQSTESPSRHQRAADPRRESTVLCKGFSQSTAESGLLEVDEIAHINGSPEFLRAAQTSASGLHAEALTIADAAQPSDMGSEPVREPSVASSHSSSLIQQQQQQQQLGAINPDRKDAEVPAAQQLVTADIQAQTDFLRDPADSGQAQYEPALDQEHSSPQLQSSQQVPVQATKADVGVGQVAASTGAVKPNVPLPLQVVG